MTRGKITCSRNKIEPQDESVGCEDGSRSRGHDGMGPYVEALTLKLFLGHCDVLETITPQTCEASLAWGARSEQQGWRKVRHNCSW